MPIYTYQCLSCHNIFEQYKNYIVKDHKIILPEDSSSVCPQCQNIAIKIISPIGGLIFNGSGFYKTDYKK